MTRRGRGLTEDEDKLWKGVTHSVAPLRARPSRDKAEISATAEQSPRKPAVKKSPPAATPRLPAKQPSPPPLAPLDRKLKSRIARGSTAIEARLDLHGMTQAEAHGALLRFLRGAQGKGATVVLVITGKGGSGVGERGVLNRQVPLWLRLPEFRDYVVGFEEAAIAHGGAGALYVRLRKKRDLTK
ncbi:MAG: Smr/MutS family protein [Rhizobiales bacterium]|nr:Smr/MutS family protein [Hyphomicrobiales bacterium]